MTDTNLSAVLYKKRDLRMVDRSIPEPGPGEVQICMKSVGVCGTDVHFWQEGRIGDAFVVKEPMLLGHECSGVVSKVGEGVTHLKQGDRVAIEPHGVCRTCEACKGGRYNLCPRLFVLATPPGDGALTRYITHGADFVFKLPDNVSFEEGALLEPLSVALHACNRARVTLGDKILVCGAGPVGLCVMLAARAYGASSIILTDEPKMITDTGGKVYNMKNIYSAYSDVREDRLEFARKLGATHVLKIDKEEESEGVAAKIVLQLGDAPNKAIECSGATSSIHYGIKALKPGGVFVLVGVGPAVTPFPALDIVVKEIQILGSLRYLNTWPTAIEMVSNGRINVAPLVSHHYKLEQTLEAFEKAMSGDGMKIMIDCSKDV